MKGRMAMVAAMLVSLGLAGCTGSPPCDVPAGPAAGENPIVVMETNFGCISAEIFVDKVPTTGGNFVALVEDGRFNDTPFHRVIDGFMMQGGDYTMGNGRGGAAHPDFDEDGDGNIPDEFHADLRHDKKGVLSMANAGPGTGSSQFFITFGPTPWLDDRHAVFGQVVAGMDVVDRIDMEAGTSVNNGVPPKVPVDFIGAYVLHPEAG